MSLHMVSCRLSRARSVLVKLEIVRLSMKPTLSLTSRQPKTNIMTSSIHVPEPSLCMLPSMLGRDSLDLGVFCFFCAFSEDDSSKLRFSPRPVLGVHTSSLERNMMGAWSGLSGCLGELWLFLSCSAGSREGGIDPDSSSLSAVVAAPDLGPPFLGHMRGLSGKQETEVSGSRQQR